MVKYINFAGETTSGGGSGGPVPAIRVQLRRGTDAEFLQMQDEVIARGEPVICYRPNNIAQYGAERGTVLFLCVGDGINKLKDLLKFRPDVGTKAAGRQMRNLSSAASITSAVPGLDFATERDALEALLYLYSPPYLRFLRNNIELYEVGATGFVQFLVKDYTGGSYEIVRKRLIDVTGNTVLQTENGPATTDMSVNFDIGTISQTNSFHTFAADVTNARPTAKGGNDTYTAQVTFEFRHAVGYGYIAADATLDNLTDAAAAAYFNSNACAKSIESNFRHLSGVQNLNKGIIFMPTELAGITTIKQNAQPSNIRGLFSLGQKSITRTIGGANVYTAPYNVYIQQNPTGSGGVNFYDFS